MAISFNAVEKAYRVMTQLLQEFGSPQRIPSFPSDIMDFDDRQMENLPSNQVFGCDKKYDNGWESLFFLVENPSPEFIKRFKQLAKSVPNSMVVRPYQYNSKLTKFGWF